ncbi:precorrin-3B synthase [Aminobacter aminovorans]|uniref:Sulfite reductase [ferredoxin] n=1 Tax=Aminobacter aminovorans TaxID=83263 RepID=A0A380WJZ0_AMIAI|nr:precorrin-3B synthase [Aminobacter aminovorans]SUU89329.1 Sulfite reductase [ferredoxin] [Aminobacter aminovorans]
MTGFSRRGACPALSAPMSTGDGLLVRLNPLAGEIAPNVLIGLCESAARHGNGIVEVTARGSIQIRGLTSESACLLAEEVEALGIAVRTGVPVDIGPLAGMDPAEVADPKPVAAAIRTAIAEVDLGTRLGPKVSVVVDGRGQIGLGNIIGDVRLVAKDAELWRLSVAGDESSARLVGEFDPDAACAATLDILRAIAALGRQGRARDLSSEVVRAAIAGFQASHSFAPPSVLPDISPARGEIGNFAGGARHAALPMDGDGGDSQISPLAGEMSGRTEGGGKDRDAAKAAALEPESIPEHSAATDSSAIGILSLSGNQIALGIALPFGSIEASALIAFCRAAAAAGATCIRPAPGRTLLVMGLDGASAANLTAAASSLGFVMFPNDPRIRIAACPGAPACASGMIAARDVAAEIAHEIGESLDPTLSLHVSGCAKGCAHPGPATLTIVGDEKGAVFVVGGTAKGLPAAYTAGYEAARGMGRLTKLLAQERKPDENAAACLARLGAKRLAQALAQE